MSAFTQQKPSHFVKRSLKLHIYTHIYITLYGKKTYVENVKLSRNLGIETSSGLSTFFSPVNLSLKMVWFSEVEELYRT